MPWKTSTMISQRSEFILKTKSGNWSHSELCREYGISRNTGYKWIRRFDDSGLDGLRDRSRRPKNSKSQVSHEITVKIVAYRQAHPRWGATKIRKLLLKDFKKLPSRRTIHRVMQECNLISTRLAHKRRKRKIIRTIIKPKYANQVWTVDFKGWWRTRDGKKVYPLTIRDEFSKYILSIRMLPHPTLDAAKQAFIECFERYGLPEYIRSDNGTPFAFSQGLCGLSRLSAWWLKLGIVANFIPPGSPQYNGGHERMHRDMAQELEITPARNITEQQLVADGWREDFNLIRPHQALNDSTPSKVYRKSNSKYRNTEPALEYPTHMLSRYVNTQGWFRYNGTRYFLSKAVGSENIGLELTTENRMNIWFATTCIAHINLPDSCIVEHDLITGVDLVIQKAA